MRKLYQIPIYILVFGYLLFEELIWNKLAKPIAVYLNELNFFHFIENKILKSLNATIVLTLFLSLFIIVEVLGFVALALIGKGLVVSGVLIYIGKIPVASFAFWIFKVSKEKLLTISWFLKVYTLIIKFLDWIKNSSYYKNSVIFLKESKEKIRLFFKSEKELFVFKFAKAIYRKGIK